MTEARLNGVVRGLNLARTKHTLVFTLILQQHNARLAESDRPKGRSHHRTASPQELFRLVYVVCTLTATSHVLRVDRIDHVSTCTDAKDKRVLVRSAACRFFEGQGQSAD